ncbi:hypothetical protein H5410_052453, partial [Solanum commersonii]
MRTEKFSLAVPFYICNKQFKSLEAGIKGNTDAGNTEVPRIFILPTKTEESVSSCETKFIFPVIDPIKHKEIVGK